MSKYSFALSKAPFSHVAWVESVSYQIEDVVLQNRHKSRRLFFDALPREETEKLNIVPNKGSRISLLHSEASTTLGVVSTSYMMVNGENCPIDQEIEIYIDRDFFNDIYAMCDAKLLLYVTCGVANKNDSDFKEQPIVSFRLSPAVNEDHVTTPSKLSLASKLFK